MWYSTKDKTEKYICKMKNRAWGKEPRILTIQEYDEINENDFPILFYKAWICACRITGGDRLYGC